MQNCKVKANKFYIYCQINSFAQSLCNGVYHKSGVFIHSEIFASALSASRSTI